MSYPFTVDGETVWDPAPRVGLLYAGITEAVSEVVRQPTGLKPSADGTCAIDVAAFHAFVECLRESQAATRHPVYGAMMKGVLAVSLQLAKKTGAELTPMYGEEQPIFGLAADLRATMSV
jgi:hypothetical protein